MALLCTNIGLDTEQIIAHFILRRSMEVTFEESQAHVGIETTKAMFGCCYCSQYTLFIGPVQYCDGMGRQNKLQQQQLLKTEKTAWYQKQKLNFFDAIAAVRRSIWQKDHFLHVPS